MFWPQGSGHGDTHFLFLHVFSEGHSALTTHSGLQFGGDPLYSGKHEQMLRPFETLHWLFGPQGDGWHGLTGKSSWAAIMLLILIMKIKKIPISNCSWYYKYYNLRSSLHAVNGSPMYPVLHVQRGEWLTTWQLAFDAHVPGHGSIHLFLVQALLLGQSELTTHSGWQPSYGFPIYPFRQMQAPALARSIHSAFAPQGEGSQAESVSNGTTAFCEHWIAASPLYPSGQMQTAVWLTTRHSAFEPHAFSHGFWHFLLIQAKWGAHSLFARHSGRQFGGAPMYSGIHWQEGIWLPFSWQIELGPHGDGWQGFIGAVGNSRAKIRKHQLQAHLFFIIQFNENLKKISYLRVAVQRVNGSPVKPVEHVQMGLWCITWHWAATPQVPWHGLIHFWLLQALSDGQSELATHSGRQ